MLNVNFKTAGFKTLVLKPSLNKIVQTVNFCKNRLNGFHIVVFIKLIFSWIITDWFLTAMLYETTFE